MGLIGAFFGALMGGLVKAFIQPVRDWWAKRQEIKRARREEAERVEAERLQAEYDRIKAEQDKADQALIDDLNEKFGGRS